MIYDDDEEEGPSTREIIANQSQDYVDEKLAQYQYTILQLQGKCVALVCSGLMGAEIVALIDCD